MTSLVFIPEGGIKPFVSFDTILVATLVLPHLWFNQTASAAVIGAVGLYALIDVLVPWAGKKSGKLEQWSVRRAFTLKFYLLFVLIAIIVFVPALYYIIERPHGQPDPNLHDGAFQTEIALKYLAHGENPYAETYVGTGLESYVLTDAPENPALYNFAYMPFVLFASVPFDWLFSWALGWFDERVVYLIAFALVLGLLPQLTSNPANKLALLALVGLNFYTAEFLRAGRNDVLVFLLLLAVIMFLRGGRIKTASVFLALACATKPSAWFFIPFFSVFVSGSISLKENAVLWTRRMPFFWLTLAIVIGPFLIWDPAAFYRGTVAYILGIEGTVPYPIRGFGLSALLLRLGIIPSAQDRFPFWILELMGGLPVLWMAWRLQSRRNTMDIALYGYTAFFFLVAFVSRFFQDNYYHFALLTFVVAIFMDPFHYHPVGRSQELIVGTDD